MAKLRKAARGQECSIRLPGVCNWNSETTVGAHFRMSDICGMGKKPPDLFSADACSSCHDACDGRLATEFTRDELRMAHAEGVFRTQYRRLAEGKIKI